MGKKQTINVESQLSRVEKKVDRILELLEGKELSTSVVIDSKRVGEVIFPFATHRQQPE